MGDSMSDSPEPLVRKFFAAWADPKPDELAAFSMTPLSGSTVRK
jgi:hypothetical protein